MACSAMAMRMAVERANLEVAHMRVEDQRGTQPEPTWSRDMFWMEEMSNRPGIEDGEGSGVSVKKHRSGLLRRRVRTR